MLRNPGGLIGLIILAIAVLVALFGPLLFPTSPWRMVQRPFLPPFTLSTVPLGTDIGRSVTSSMVNSLIARLPANSIRSPVLPVRVKSML